MIKVLIQGQHKNHIKSDSYVINPLTSAVTLIKSAGVNILVDSGSPFFRNELIEELKIENLIDWERKYAKFFKPEDKEMLELKNQILALEQELGKEREEKYMVISENNEKITQLTESLNGLKSKANHLLMDKAKRHHRLKALEQKIREKVDVHKYYHS